MLTALLHIDPPSLAQAGHWLWVNRRTVLGWLLAVAGPFYRPFGREIAGAIVARLKRRHAVAFDFKSIESAFSGLTGVIGDAVKVEGEAVSGAPLETVIADGVAALGAALAAHYPTNPFVRVAQSKAAVAALVAAGEADVKAAEEVAAVFAAPVG